MVPHMFVLYYSRIGFFFHSQVTSHVLEMRDADARDARGHLREVGAVALRDGGRVVAWLLVQAAVRAAEAARAVVDSALRYRRTWSEVDETWTEVDRQ